MKDTQMHTGFFGIFRIGLLGVFLGAGFSELRADVFSTVVQRPPIKIKRISKHISYPGVQGSPIVQDFYLWVEVSKKMKRSMKRQVWGIDFDSFYWAGYRGLGSYGVNGAEVKSMRISSPTNESRYWDDRFNMDSANKNWMLIVGTVEIPTRDTYDIPFSSDSSDKTERVSGNIRFKRVPWESGDAELRVFYSVVRWQDGVFQKVSHSEIRVDKIRRVTAVFHP